MRAKCSGSLEKGKNESNDSMCCVTAPRKLWTDATRELARQRLPTAVASRRHVLEQRQYRGFVAHDAASYDCCGRGRGKRIQGTSARQSKFVACREGGDESVSTAESTPLFRDADRCRTGTTEKRGNPKKEPSPARRNGIAAVVLMLSGPPDSRQATVEMHGFVFTASILYR